MSKSIEEASQRSEPQTAESHPTREEIEVRAYKIHVERGGAHGQDVDDWLQAERELIEEYGTTGGRGKVAAA